MKALVTAAQDLFRERTFAGTLPADYGKAQTVILRYADLCSTLGMQALLNQSTNQQRKELQDQIPVPVSTATPSSSPSPSPSPAPSPTPTPVPSAVPTQSVDRTGAEAAPMAVP